ncbi:DEAD/DEAH box helicase family protein [Enterocloster clostridioformis]|uniref:DEAD/DEAH box helicase family protein n=1 Tax=Enterocloster clostridioformis TaxID=1531 RepID=UPI0008EA9DC9|nr:DEAD/DEAH box helicase family protein [Enterocloster clostridioformis]SFG94957.1 Superfamily II DNA or RNA helicase [Enterocloster clostridioformis]
MERSVFELLSKITQALDNGEIDGKQAPDYLAKCIDSLLNLGPVAENEVQNVLHEYLPVFDQLIALLPEDDAEAAYYRSVTAIIRGDYQDYLDETEKFYTAKSAKSPRWLDWPAAAQYFVSVVERLPVLEKWDDQIAEKIVRAHQKYAGKYFPKSAFDLYCKFWISKGSDQHRLKLLRDVLDKDPGWFWAWIEIGDIYYDQKKWAQALEAYQHAMEDERTHFAGLFNAAAWAANYLKDPDSELRYSKRCVELDPAFPYAQNNLGWCLNRKKQYAQAEPYLRYALEHDENIKSACRNLFDALEKLGKTEELLNLVQQHPEQFRTKYYRERLGKIRESDERVDMEELQKLLQKTTANEYAGTITVSPEQSGIRLYEHQKQAVRNLDEWKRTGDSGAGLLVLPTGGGKTLTATYWLMKSILDNGGKVLWIAHRHELLNQAFHAFERVCYQDLSPHKKEHRYRIISGQHDKAVHIRPEDDILIASKSSLTHDLSHIRRKWIEANRGHICMVIDEAHHAPASEYRKLIQTMQESGGDFRLLGLTATPFRTAEKEQGLLSKLFPDDILYKIDLRTLIEQGILSDPIFHPIETKIKMADWFHEENADALLERIVNEKGFDFDSPGALGEQAARLIAAHSERNRLIVDTYVNNQAIYGKTLVFTINVDMAIALNTLFQERGIRSDYVVSSIRDAATGVNRSNEENRAILQRFRDGELDVLVNVNILTEGTDLPQVQSVFLTRPTKSTILMTQMIGRALRGERAGGTAKAYIVSFLDDWQEYIAWVNPEKLFIDTNADFSEQTSERRAFVTRLVSIAKLEEFARLADDNLDDGISEQFTFLERIPVGLYQFTYLPDGEDESRNCTVLVYDCMQEAYQELTQWMETADLSDLDAAVGHVDQILFGEKERLLGYHEQDVYDILAYYRQTGAKPQWIPLEERAEYDVARIAKHIVDNDLRRTETRQYIENEWNRANGKWMAFFGYHNENAFYRAIQLECNRLERPVPTPATKPLTQKEEIQIQDLPLEEIRRRFPAIGEKLRNAIFEKFQDAEGYFFSAESGYRSKNRLDFQIDHIRPMSQGGKTTLDNLQLLTRQENGSKGDDWQE